MDGNGNEKLSPGGCSFDMCKWVPFLLLRLADVFHKNELGSVKNYGAI